MPNPITMPGRQPNRYSGVFEGIQNAMGDERERKRQADEKEKAAKAAQDAADRQTSWKTGEMIFKAIKDAPSYRQGPMLETVGHAIRFSVNDREFDLGPLFDPDAKWQDIAKHVREKVAKDKDKREQFAFDQLKNKAALAEKYEEKNRGLFVEKREAEIEAKEQEAAKAAYFMSEDKFQRDMELRGAGQKPKTQAEIKREREARTANRFKEITNQTEKQYLTTHPEPTTPDEVNEWNYLNETLKLGWKSYGMEQGWHMLDQPNIVDLGYRTVTDRQLDVPRDTRVKGVGDIGAAKEQHDRMRSKILGDR